MKVRHSQALKAWLEERLERLCEADPAALSKYVLALIQKEKEMNDLKKSCMDQLEVFLGGETSSFVDKLFSAISSGSYISGNNSTKSGSDPESEHSDAGSTPRASSSPSEATSPVTHHGGRDRRHTEIDDDDRDFKRARRGHSSSTSPSPERGPALKVVPTASRLPATESVPKSQTGNIINLKQKNTWRNVSGRSGQRLNLTLPSQIPGFSGLPRGLNPFLQQVKPLRKERCKDFDEKGVCMLGESCPYDHGTDPLVVGTMLPWGPSGPNTNMATMSQFHSMGQQRLPSIPNFGNISGLQNQSVLGGGFPLNTPTLMSTSTSDTVVDNGYNPDNPAMTLTGPGGLGLLPQGLPGMVGPGSLPLAQGMRPYQRGNKRQRIPTDCLMVRNVPPDKNTITTLSSHFQQFGTIINIRVRFNGDPHTSLVQFSTTGEAQRAFESSEAVLGNRFIKLFYFKSNDNAPRQKKRKEEIFDVTSGVEIALSEALVGASDSQSNVTMTAVSTVTATSSTQSNTTFSATGITKPGSVSTAPQGVAMSTTPGTAGVRGNDRPPPAPSSERPSPSPGHERSSHTPSKAQLAKQTAVSRKMSTLQKQLDSLKESLDSKVKLQAKVKGLINKQLETQKSLIGKLDNSKSLSDVERKKAMETLKEMSTGVSKLNEQALALKSAILKLTKEKQTVEVALTEAGKDLKALKDAEVQAMETARQVGPVAKNDLRNKISKKKLLVMDVDTEDHLKLASLFESVGNLLEVSVDPDNSRNLIFTFSKRADAEKAVRSITSFNSKPVIMKWYTHTVPVSSTENKMEMEPTPAPSKQVSEIVEKSPKSAPETLNLERRKSEMDDLFLLSPGSDSQALLQTPTDDKVLDDSHLDDSLLDDDDEEDAESKSWKRL